MRGGGTSQAGQAIGAGLIVDTSKYLTAILELNAEQQWVRVEPGVVLDELNAQLRPHGLRFAPDVSTASRATVGGMMANNSSGARSVIYGKTIDHVIEQEVVLSDGSVVTFGPLAEGDYERALEWLLGAATDGPPEQRDRVREVMVAVFQELGQEHPVSTAYRRRLATALY